MNKMDCSENNAKVSDAGYSNSCTNSQSRRSHSSKSTHSESNSSGSSGYGGKPSSSGYSSNNQSQIAEKRNKEKELKKKRPMQFIQSDLKANMAKKAIQKIPLLTPVFEFSKAEIVAKMPNHGLALKENKPEKMDISDRSSGKDELSCPNSPVGTIQYVSSLPNQNNEGFSCVISLQDGVVMYTTPSITASLGYPKDLWMERSFIDFVHQRDRKTFASQITSGLLAPKSTSGEQPQVPLGETVSTMVCRLRRYNGLNKSFTIKEKIISYSPFQLSFSFKSMTEEDKEVMYLVINAKPFFSAFRTPNEVVTDPLPFVIRHTPNGKINFIDVQSVPYLGYLPQDIMEEDALQLYYPNDLLYLREMYETVVKEGTVGRSKPYRMIAQNGDYLKLETEWTSFTNPWSKKIEFVIGKHYVIEGPKNPDVFQTPDNSKAKLCNEEAAKAQAIRESMIRIMNEVLTKTAELAKQQMAKRCEELAIFMESLFEKKPKAEEELRVDVHEPDHSFYDSVMLGGVSPHHDHNDSMTNKDTPLTYKQLNYNDNLQRFFECHETYTEEDKKALSMRENAIIFEMEVPDAEFGKSASTVGEIEDMATSSDSSVVAPTTISSSCGYPTFRLTESLLNKHNVEMEKELVKTQHEVRAGLNKNEKERSESRQKMKEHIARCNAAYEPTNAALTDDNEGHGVKRSRDSDDENSYKRGKSRRKSCHTHSAPQSLNNNGLLPVDYAPPMPYQVPPRSDLAAPHYDRHSNMAPVNPQMQYHHMPQQMNPHCSTGAVPNRYMHNNMQPAYPVHVPNPQMPCMMMGQPFYGGFYVYPQMEPRVPYVHQGYIQQQMPNTQPLGLSNRNYEENKADSASAPKKARLEHSDTNEKTDGESSYSSFYSSFFKTDSGSNEESVSKSRGKRGSKASYIQRASSYGKAAASTRAPKARPVSRRNMKPPWLENVNATSDLFYKYQIPTRDCNEVLSNDKEKLKLLDQPQGVNEQLSQLYSDLQLQGAPPRITLEEGITSSSSSSEDTPSKPKPSTSKPRRRNLQYDRLALIHEADAPMPPPEMDVPMLSPGSSSS
ncbi:period circadian protein isoform X2 [Pararge aegeria]|uniref:period circadian protein isoform X2 n=1 Tax=Pararge aegeria TaxID=116150 RepID=UPI0019D1507B|nr:period circadian protein isoform X2 [Pararge aegeria]